MLYKLELDDFTNYTPLLNPVYIDIFGSIDAALMFQQINYMSPTDGKPLYFFYEPCDHPKYKKGHSFAEIFRFSAKKTQRILKKIGQFLGKGSKKDYKACIWYWRTRENVMKFQINIEGVEGLVAEYKKNKQPKVKAEMYKKVKDIDSLGVDKDIHTSGHGTPVMSLVKEKDNKNRELFNSFDSKTLFIVEELFTFTVDTKISKALKKDNPLLLKGFEFLQKRFKVSDSLIQLSSTSKPIERIIEEIIKRGYKKYLNTYTFLTLLHAIKTLSAPIVLMMLKKYIPKPSTKQPLAYLLSYDKKNKYYKVHKELFPTYYRTNKRKIGLKTDFNID